MKIKLQFIEQKQIGEDFQDHQVKPLTEHLHVN